MKRLGKITGMALVLALLVSLLPAPVAAQDTVSGADLRAGVVERVEAIMDVDWTLQTRQAKADIAGELLEAYKAGGILPTTYFEYSRLRFNYKGVMVEDQAATLEEFAAMADPNQAMVPGIGHNPYSNAELKGMDINSFLTDISTRVLSQPLTGLKQALTSSELTALAQGADLSAASSAAAISYDAAKAGYAKLGAGDLLLAWDNAATGVEGGGPRIHALVVKAVDGDRVTVMYPAFSLLLWYFKCEACGAVDTEGPTSAALPGHVMSQGYSFGKFLTHEGCGGTWAPLYATTWRTETVSHEQLYGSGDNAVPYASRGYLPYTFNAYGQGAPAAEVKVSTDMKAENYMNGFTAHITSDWRITGVKAEISRGGQTVSSYTAAPAMGAKEYTFSQQALDEALRTCPGNSTNRLTLYVRSGPMTQAQLDGGAWAEAYSLEFTVGNDVLKLTADKTYLEQGEQLQVSVDAVESNMTGVKALVTYDPEWYVFEEEATRAKNPGVRITHTEGLVTAEYYGSAIPAGKSVAQLLFHPVRTGSFPIQAKDNGQIYCSGAYLTQKAGATAADLVAGKPSSLPIQPAVGYNTIICENYAGGMDLLLLFTSTYEQKFNQTDSTLMMTYDGKPMYDVTAGRYETGEGDIQRIYAAFTQGADVNKLAVGTVACEQVVYSDDVNGSGGADVSDLQTVANIIAGRLPLAGNEIKWLRADADRSGKVDQNDLAALWARIAG